MKLRHQENQVDSERLEHADIILLDEHGNSRILEYQKVAKSRDAPRHAFYFDKL